MAGSKICAACLRAAAGTAAPAASKRVRPVASLYDHHARPRPLQEFARPASSIGRRAFSSSPANPSEGRNGASSNGESSRRGDSSITTKLSEDAKLDHRHQYNYDPFTLTPSEHHYHYPLVTAKDLANSSKRPREVRMLASDFIHDSLYNPHYGYFSRQAVLLPHLEETLRETTQQTEAATSEIVQSGFDFSGMSNERDFMQAVQARYDSFERNIEREAEEQQAARAATQEAEAAVKMDPKVRRSSAEGLEQAQAWGRAMAARDTKERVLESDVMAMAARQVWHTPTELFKPHYAEAVARYLVGEYKLHLYPYEDLIIYEVGAGSGTLAEGILNYIQREEPQVYERTRYRIVEISARLAQQQLERLAPHRSRVEVHQKSILEWDQPVADPCFVIALEVLDNLAHDVVRYHTGTLQPYQAIVSIDETGDMHELWEPAKDPKILRYLAMLNGVEDESTPTTYSVGIPRRLRLVPGPVRRVLSDHFPFYPNLTAPHYIATGSLQLLDVLRLNFPLHRLVLSDFSVLPDAVQGLNGPVVQTRYKGTMIPVTTYRVLQGFFDIFFPTNFEELRQIYGKVMSGFGARKSDAGHGFQELPRASPMATSSSLRPDYFSSRTQAQAREGASGLEASDLSRRQSAQILSHSDFLRRYARTEAVRLKDGSNPMLSWYANARWLLM